MKYIAYGSNMEQNAMCYRCPEGKLLGMGKIVNMRLEFFVHATVVYARDESVPVAVWEISNVDEQKLDWYEGYPDYYRKEQHTVHMADGSQIEGMVYVMNESKRYHQPPADSYYRGIRDAYTQLGLKKEIKHVLVPALERSLMRR